MKDIGKVRELLWEAQRIFRENCTGCEFHSVAKVGIVKKKEISVCNHPDRDSEEDPMFMCGLPHCPLLS